MGRPQQPELERAGRTPVDPEHPEQMAKDRAVPEEEGRTGRVPPDNRAGHRPERDQDIPKQLGGAGRPRGRKKR